VDHLKQYRNIQKQRYIDIRNTTILSEGPVSKYTIRVDNSEYQVIKRS